MQDIANATFNYANLNEIMPMIYKRFTEKAAEEWRQIYKALQLLEFLIKNGSERVIDDARSHLSLLKMLRQFHFIDQNGKDQGINVRNRAKELAELLADVERIRSERKKARTNRNKYGGVEGGGGLGGGSSSAPRYGGFGSETGGVAGQYGGFSGGVYGDGGGFGGATEEDYSNTQERRENFEEYDEYDEGTATAPKRKTTETTTSPTASRRTATKAEAVKPAPKPKVPEVDLFDFGDDPIASTPISATNGKQTAPANDFGIMQSPPPADDDEFDDFQSATPIPSTAPSFAPPLAATSAFSSTAQFAAPSPQSNNLYAALSPPPSSTASNNYSAFTSPTLASQYQQPSTTSSFSSLQPQQQRPAGYQAAQPNYFGAVSTPPPSGPTSPLSSNGAQKPAFTSSANRVAGGDPFASLAGLGGLGGKKSGVGAQKGPTMADLNKERASAGIWGAATTGSTQRSAGGAGSGGDLLGL